AIILAAHPGLERVEDRLVRRVSDEVWAKRAREMLWEDFLQVWNEQRVLIDSLVSPRQQALEVKRSSIALAFETWSLGRQENLRSPLRRFQSPVLWITGEKDTKFTALAEEMEGVLVDMKRVEIPGAGHRVLGEQAGEVILEWLGIL
ncbi:MAG: hypothetical protein AAF357_19900, partial [Verrucomicrobiota bacterium]